MLPAHIQGALDECMSGAARFAFPETGNAFADMVAAETEDIQRRFVTCLVILPDHDESMSLECFPDTVIGFLKSESASGGRMVLWESGYSDLSRKFEKLREHRNASQKLAGHSGSEAGWEWKAIHDSPWGVPQLRLVVARYSPEHLFDPMILELLRSSIDLIFFLELSRKHEATFAPELHGLSLATLVVARERDQGGFLSAFQAAPEKLIVLDRDGEAALIEAFKRAGQELGETLQQCRALSLLVCIKKELGIEQDRLAAIIGIREKAGKAGKALNLRGDDDWLRRKQQAKERTEFLLAQIESRLVLDDLGVKAEQLVSGIEVDSLEVREIISPAAMNTIGGRSRIRVLFNRDYQISITRECIDSIARKISKVCSKQIERDAVIVSKELGMIEEEVRAIVSGIVENDDALRRIELPRLEKNTYANYGNDLDLAFYVEEKSVRKGLFGHFLEGQGVAMRLFSVAGMLFMGGAALNGVFLWVGGMFSPDAGVSAAELLKPSRGVMQPFLSLVVIIAILIFAFRIRNSKYVEADQKAQILGKLVERLAGKANELLKQVTKTREQIHKQHLRRVKDALDRYWTYIDDVVRAQQQELANEQNVLAQSNAAVLANFKDKQVRVQALVQQVAQCANGLQKAPDTLRSQLRIILAAIHASSSQAALESQSDPASPLQKPPGSGPDTASTLADSARAAPPQPIAEVIPRRSSVSFQRPQR
ncbi:hypothetical protein [Zoogloea sp.]|uniref:hypothetical protein n=1 Tax=Zoogloea sp. TaxID=49181 RepID=UPI0025FF91AA|nr:hypothetical protein [Zoogloea sp.]MCK6394550.1 hypothetical protein [Zoogloea sp.]